MSTIYVGGKTFKEHIIEEEVFRCSECAGPNPPNAEKCQYCGYWFKEPPKPVVVREVIDEDVSYSPKPMQMLRQVIYFSIVLLVVSIMGSIFTNNTIQADFTEASVLAASLLGIVLFLGAVRLVNL